MANGDGIMTNEDRCVIVNFNCLRFYLLQVISSLSSF